MQIYYSYNTSKFTRVLKKINHHSRTTNAIKIWLLEDSKTKIKSSNRHFLDRIFKLSYLCLVNSFLLLNVATNKIECPWNWNIELTITSLYLVGGKVIFLWCEPNISFTLLLIDGLRWYPIPIWLLSGFRWDIIYMWCMYWSWRLTIYIIYPIQVERTMLL